MVKAEYVHYVNETITIVDDLVWKLLDAMNAKDEDLVVAICDELVEEFNIIKETYTDESLL